MTSYEETINKMKEAGLSEAEIQEYLDAQAMEALYQELRTLLGKEDDY